ncbi:MULTISPECIES: helix-turn-helix domain-containing protein [unclassified Parafrankia]|uniref:helix-turn-helix domain-containing protein n=1 Tax=unclassified Parafrankia TaxID=2994368 RepID=UPI000DA5D661
MRGSPPSPSPLGLAELPEAARAEALRRWRVLRPYLEDGVPLPRAAGDAGVRLRTAERWLARYRTDGLAGLVRSARSDRGTRRLPNELRLLIEGLALRPPGSSAAHVHRVVAGVAKDQGWSVPAYATVYAVIRDIDPAMRTLALDGDKRYREVFDLIHRREASSPNEIWQADHTQLDLWVLGPSGKPARPWLTVIEDDHSRAIAGYAVNLGAPSAIQTALALRGRRSGARVKRAGMSVASPPPSTPTTARTSPPSTWSRSPPT